MNVEAGGPRLDGLEVKPTQGQINAAGVEFYFALHDLFGETARDFVARRRGRLQRKAAIALEDIYFAGDDQEKLGKCAEVLGEEFPVYQGLLESKQGLITSLSTTYNKLAPTIGRREAFGIGTRAAIRSKWLTNEQRAHAAELGYEEKKKTEAIINTGLALGSNAAFFYWAFGGFAAAAVASSQTEFFRDNQFLLTRAAWGFHYAVAVLNSQQIVRLLNNPAIGTSPDWISTSSYYLARKIAPNHKSVQEWAARVGHVLPMVGQDLLFVTSTHLVGALGGDVGDVTWFSRNAAGSATNILQAGLAEAALRDKKTTLETFKEVKESPE